jgi:hypothetical protein
VLFTDIVGSTDIARELGDERWRELVRRHHALVRRELKRFEGHEVDTAGDGFFAVFDSPGAAIRCAVAITEAVREVGLEVRAGLHGGEVVSSEGKAGGIAVNTAARVMAVAGFGEVLVSGSLRDVVAGSALGFEDHGVHTLKGIEGEWHLHRVAIVDGERVGEPLDGAEASRLRLAVEPRREPKPGSRRLALVGGGVVVAIVAALVLVVARSDGNDVEEPPDAGPGNTGPGVTAAAGPPLGSLVKVDAASGEIEFVRADVPGGARAFPVHELEVGLGSAWLQRIPIMLKIDLQDGSHTPIRGLEGDVAAGSAVGAEELWVVGRRLSAVDPATGRVVEELEYLPGGETFLPASDVVEAFGRVWIPLNDGSVIVVDPATGDVVTAEVGDTPERIATGTDAMWVLDDSAGTVWRLDPATARVLDGVALSGSQDEVTVGGGFVWVLDAALGTLTPIEETGGGVRPGIQVGQDAADLAFALGSVWVASGGEVLEVDPTTARVVRTIEIGDNPISSVAVDEEDGALWLDIAAVR